MNTDKATLIHQFYKEPRRMSSPVQRADNDSRVVKGYGVVFDQRTTLYDDGEYRIDEVIKRESVEGLLSGDVISEYNHDKNMLLGRTSNNTLRLNVDDKGVHYEVDVPNTSYGNDLLELVERGDVKGSSFQARIASEGIEVSRLSSKHLLMTVTKMTRFAEIGPVYSPAYEQTTATRNKDILGLFDVKELVDEAYKGDEVKRAETLRANTLCMYH